MHRRTAIAVIGATALLQDGVALAAKKLLNGVPLVWKPTTELGSLAPVNITGLSGRKIQVQPFADAREKPDLIGENREDADEGKILPVTTKDDVPAFLTDRFRFVTHYFGVDTIAEPGDVVITGEVRSFFVAEENTYKGDVAVKIQVKSKTGEVLWDGVMTGGESRWGRSYKADNYYEVLSDSLINAIHRVLTTQEFMAALRR